MERVASIDNVVTKHVSGISSLSSSGAGPPGNAPDSFFASLFERFPTMPKWVGIAAVASTTALAAAGCYYFFYSRGKGHSKPTTSTIPAKKTEPKIEANDFKSLGNDFFKKQEFMKALECYTKGIESGNQTHEQLSVLHQNRAAVFEKLGDKLQVINECSLALKYQPNYNKALLRRAKAYKDTGFLDDALEDVTTICLLQQFQGASAVQLADDLLKEIGIREARKICKNRKPSEPGRQFIIAFLRSFHEDPVTKAWNGGESPSCNGDNEVNNSTEEEFTKSPYQLAVEKIQRNEFSEIIQLCDEEISSKDSKYKLEAYLMRGTFRYLFGYTTGVLDDLDAVIETVESSPLFKASAWIKIGLFLRQAEWESPDDDWRKAFEKAKECTPNNPDVYQQWGQQLLLRGEYEEAANKIQKACECSESFALPHATKSFITYRLGTMQEDHQKIGTALIEFNKLETKFPNCAELFTYYGQVLMEMQRFEEAHKIFEHVSQLEPLNTSTSVHKALCESQKHSGLDTDITKYIKKLRDTLKIDNKNPFVWETIGSLEVQTGNQAGAVEAITKGLELARTFPEIAMVAALKAGTEMQFKVKAKLNLF